MGEQPFTELFKLAQERFNIGDFLGYIHWSGQAEICAYQSAESNNQLLAIAAQAVGWSNAGNIKKQLENATRLISRARSYGNEKYLMSGTRLFASGAAEIDLRNRWNEIRQILLEGLETSRRIRDNYEESYHLTRLGGYAIDMGEEAQGYAWLQEALNTLTSLNTYDSAYFRCCINQSLAILMRKRADYAEAVRYVEIALGAAREEGNPLFVSEAQLTFAGIERARRELPRAMTLVDEVLTRAPEMKWLNTERSAEYMRGELLRELGNAEAAAASARNALHLSRELQ